MARKHKILIVDDEAECCELLSEVFKVNFFVFTAKDGAECLDVARAELPDIILLDVKMPKVDGLQACEQLRNNEATSHILILLLTAYSDIELRTKAFTVGADDCIEKPFVVRELFARVESKLRRLNERTHREEIITCGNLVLNVPKFEASIEGKVLPFSVLEFNLLKYFILNKDRVVSREHIKRAVWNDVIVGDRTVDTRVVYLRKKLAGFNCTLKTVYGAGYILCGES